MNSNIKILVFSTLVMLSVSCEKSLQETPTDRLASATFYKTKDDAESAVNAIYNPLRTYGDRYGAQFTAIEDYGSGRGYLIAFAQYAGPMISTTDGQYQSFYQVIRNANIVLKYIPAIPMSDTERNVLLAEASFLRALAYRNLVRSWGGVPIRLEPTENINEIGAKRASVAEVYNLIIKDLQFAESNLPATQTRAGKPTKWAAKTMLADIYLNTEKWAEARDKADEVIVSGPYSLVQVSSPAGFEQIFGPTSITSTEDVFSIKFSRTSGSNIPLFYALPNSAYSSAGYGSEYAYPNAPLLKNWDKNDLRYQFNLYTSYPNRGGTIVQNEAAQPIRFGKFKDAGFAPSHGNDYPIYRYPDALLIYAEAASQANNNPTPLAVERLNMVHRRGYGYNPNQPAPVDFTLATAPSAQSFRDLVLRERAYEFMLEGKRWFDLIRTNTAKQVIQESKGITVPDYFLLFPIPVQEIDNNPELTTKDQNPGY
jgi:hypothetical protein